MELWCKDNRFGGIIQEYWRKNVEKGVRCLDIRGNSTIFAAGITYLTTIIMKHKGIKLWASVAALATVVSMGSCSQQGPTRIENLANWDFSMDSVEWNAVTVPHSYNGVDGRTEKYYRGKAYYRNTLNLSSQDAKQPLFVCFEGAAQQATVYLNGTAIVHHKGGYTPFYVNLSGLVKSGRNELVVVCDNTLDLTLAPVGLQ